MQRSIWQIGLVAALLVSGCVPAATPSVAIRAQGNQQVRWEETAERPAARGADGLLTPAEFAVGLAVEMERQRPGWRALNHGDEVIELWKGDTPGPSLPVGPVYTAYRLAPERRGELVGEAVKEALAFFEAATNWEHARDKVLPRLVSAKEYRKLDESGAMPVHLQLSGEMFLVLDLRVNGSAALVHHGFQVAWKQPSDALYRQAFRNLGTMTPPLIRGEDDVWRFTVNDGYDTVRVLLVDRLAEVSDGLTGPLVIAIPATDRLYVFDGADEELVSRMRVQTDADFARAGSPLMKEWLTLSGQQLVLYPNTGR